MNKGEIAITCVSLGLAIWLLWLPAVALLTAIDVTVNTGVFAIINLPKIIVIFCGNLIWYTWAALSTRGLYETVLRGIEILVWFSVGLGALISKYPDLFDNLGQIFVSLGLIIPQEGQWARGGISIPVPRALRKIYELLPEIIPPTLTESETSVAPNSPTTTARNSQVRGPRPRNDVDDLANLRRNLPDIPREEHGGEVSNRIQLQSQTIMDIPRETEDWMSMGGHSQAPPEYDDGLPAFRSIAGTIRSTIGRRM